MAMFLTQINKQADFQKAKFTSASEVMQHIASQNADWLKVGFSQEGMTTAD